MVSNIARQYIYFNCNNTVAYYDENTQTYDKAVLLRTFGEQVLSAGGKKRKKGSLRYTVNAAEDGCSVSIT